MNLSPFSLQDNTKLKFKVLDKLLELFIICEIQLKFFTSREIYVHVNCHTVLRFIIRFISLKFNLRNNFRRNTTGIFNSIMFGLVIMVS